MCQASFHCSSYDFLLLSSSEQYEQSNLARDWLSLIPCVAGGCWKSPAADISGFGNFQGMPYLSKTFCFLDMMCSAEPSDRAAPRPVPVQCRPLRFPSCPCNSDPFAMVFTRWAHPICSICCTNTMQAIQDMDSGYPC